MHRGQQVASHHRNSRQGGFTTVAAHMPAAHRAHLVWTPQRLIHWGQGIGPVTAEAVTRLMAENRHPEHGYRACLGLLSLARRYGKPRLEAACALALQIGACRYRHVRDILANKRDQNTQPSAGDWVSAGHSILITGPTGAGKSLLACALARYACRRGHSALYQRVPRLQEELRIHGSGTFGKWLLQLARTDVLILDDWGMGALDSMTRSDLLEIIDDRSGSKATIITSQLPVEHWHAWIGDATIADAILDRIMQRNHRLTLTGDSLRTQAPKTAQKEQNIDPS